jgi:hypothetical protein
MMHAIGVRHRETGSPAGVLDIADRLLLEVEPSAIGGRAEDQADQDEEPAH